MTLPNESVSMKDPIQIRLYTERSIILESRICRLQALNAHGWLNYRLISEVFARVYIKNF
jgi:hypothetical protein